MIQRTVLNGPIKNLKLQEAIECAIELIGEKRFDFRDDDNNEDEIRLEEFGTELELNRNIMAHSNSMLDSLILMTSLVNKLKCKLQQPYTEYEAKVLARNLLIISKAI